MMMTRIMATQEGEYSASRNSQKQHYLNGLHGSTTELLFYCILYHIAVILGLVLLGNQFSQISDEMHPIHDYHFPSQSGNFIVCSPCSMATVGNLLQMGEKKLPKLIFLVQALSLLEPFL